MIFRGKDNRQIVLRNDQPCHGVTSILMIKDERGFDFSVFKVKKSDRPIECLSLF